MDKSLPPLSEAPSARVVRSTGVPKEQEPAVANRSRSAALGAEYSSLGFPRLKRVGCHVRPQIFLEYERRHHIDVDGPKAVHTLFLDPARHLWPHQREVADEPGVCS